MYAATAAAKALEAARANQSLGSRRVPAMIYWLGATSLLVDISSEMLTSVLPVFLLTVLTLSPLQVGALDGLFQGAAALTQVVAGHKADRSQNNRRVAWIGYAMSVAARALLLLSMAGGALFAFAALLCDRLGKGMRTAPRDALIALHADPQYVARAFGVHRTMDAVGAFAGPLLAAGILWLWVDRYDILMGTSLLFAIAGVAVFTVRVRNAPASPQADDLSNPPHLGLADGGLLQRLRALFAHRAYRRLASVVAGLGLFTVSDGMLYLMLQQQTELQARYVPMIHVGSALVFLAMAIPLSRAADRWQPRKVFLFGYLCLGLAYACVFAQVGAPMLRIFLTACLMGMHYAATDGVLAVMVVAMLEPRMRTTGLAVIVTCAGLAKLASSPLLGWIWEVSGAQQGMLGFAVGLGVCMAIAAWGLPSGRAIQPSLP